MFEAVAATKERFGRLDVVVNNAGYALVGAVEELSQQELRDELETNLFGVLHVTQAVLPVLREQGSGRIFQISSVAGLTAMPGVGGYHASKWALEGLSEALAQEVAPFGIDVTIVEPGGFATNFKDAAVYTAHAKDPYEQLHASLREQGPRRRCPDPTASARRSSNSSTPSSRPCVCSSASTPPSGFPRHTSSACGLGRSGRTCPRSPKVRSGRRSRDSSGAHARARHVDHALARVLVERLLLTREAADHERLDVGIGDVASHRSSLLSVGEHLALDGK